MVAAKDPIAGALHRFGLKHPTRPVGVSKIDLSNSFTDAFSPAQALSGATSKPVASGKQFRSHVHTQCTLEWLLLCHRNLEKPMVVTE